jgi:hypothetical protein
MSDDFDSRARAGYAGLWNWLKVVSWNAIRLLRGGLSCPCSALCAAAALLTELPRRARFAPQNRQERRRYRCLQ